MARSFYPGDLIVAAGAGTPPVLTIAAGAYFTVWSAKSGGSQYTDLKASDGVTNLPTSGSPAKPFADGNGNRPDLYGPDAVNVTLWCDTGITRYPMIPVLEVDSQLTNGAKKNVANTFTAQQTFTGTATAFSNTPTVSGNLLAHGGNLVSLLSDSTFLAAIKQVVRTVEPFGLMMWNNATSKWAAWVASASSGAGAWVDDAARPDVPPGACFYFADLYSAATMPTGTQALLYVSNGMGDKMFWNENSVLYT